MMLILFPLLAFSVIPEEAHADVESYTVDILESDVLAIYIYPITDGVSVNSGSLDRGGPVDISITLNYTIVPEYRQVTAIWTRPRASGTYNLTISFQFNSGWEYTIGVFTRDIDFYGKNVKFSGNFGEFFSFERSPGNWTISITLNSRRQTQSIFYFELPTPVNAALFLTITGLIVYSNVFLVFDTYFKNKKEAVSNRRWALCALVIIISAIAIYQLYTFSTITLSWGK